MSKKNNASPTNFLFKNHLRYIYAFIIICLPHSAALHAQTAERIQAAPAFSAEELLAFPQEGWLTNGGNLYNQRYSLLTQINRDNVDSLKAVWRTHLNGSGLEPIYSGEGQPIFYEGVLYVATGEDDVFALSIESGEILWSFEANLDATIDVICCGWNSRGVALGDGKVYVGLLDNRLIALDQKTGEPVWSVQTERWQEGFSITSAPLYYNGLVITGYAGAEYGVRGRVSAFDAATGDRVWTFYTVPGPGEFGHDSWSQDNEVWTKGGATVWNTPAVDPELGLLYFSTGNPGPDFNGSVRPGDNLFSDSIVAVDAMTGEYRWHFQEVHHDIWDYDASNPVVLFDVEIDGELRKGLAQVNKTGWVYILDRITGEPLIGIEERPVLQEPRQATAATQPYPVGDPVVPQELDMAVEGFPLINQGRIFTPFFGEQSVIIAPGAMGGANWPPSSYDPIRQTLFVCATDLPGSYQGGDSDNELAEEGEIYTGGPFGTAPVAPRGIIAAMDMTSNTVKWRYRWQDRCYSGSTATAGGLVFVGRNDGRLTALDSDTGLQLWEFQTDAGVNTSVSVFEHEGQQYVAAFSGGSLFANSRRGDSIWLFSLDGNLESLPPEAMLGVTEENQLEFTPAAGVADLANGESLFIRNCVACHGEDGKGGHGGGAVLENLTDFNAVQQRVAQGRNLMPPFALSLSAEDIRDVASFVFNDLQNR
ncbi:MAG: PQQ-binding-like beta-propeller repeat protein [Pseudohongiellaceae bacterium]